MAEVGGDMVDSEFAADAEVKGCVWEEGRWWRVVGCTSEKVFGKVVAVDVELGLAVGVSFRLVRALRSEWLRLFCRHTVCFLSHAEVGQWVPLLVGCG